MPKNRIIKLKDGRYDYQVTDGSGNRRHIRSRVRETRSDFARRCEELDILSKYSVPSLTYDELFYKWLNEHVKEGKSKSYYNVMKGLYECHIRPFYGHRPADDLKRADVYQCLKKAENSGLTGSSIQKIRSCFSAPYAWAQNSMGWDLPSPTHGLVYHPKQTKEMIVHQAISDEYLIRFFESAKDSKYKNYYKILLFTGLRPSEALGLKIKNTFGDHIEVRQGITKHGLSDLKTKAARRNLPITKSIEEALFDQIHLLGYRNNYQNEAKKKELIQIHGEEWLFPSASGIPTMNSIEHSFRTILKSTAIYDRGGRNGLKKLKLIEPPIKMTLYDFRHTFATKMVERGTEAKILQYLMGHVSISTTLEYYVDVTEKMMNDAKEIMDGLF